MELSPGTQERNLHSIYSTFLVAGLCYQTQNSNSSKMAALGQASWFKAAIPASQEAEIGG
jgi:hypothetical protein